MPAAELRLINDIARQHHTRPPDQAAEAIAAHVRKFWDPRMRARLLALVDSHAEPLDPLAAAAAGRLRLLGD
ncbi:MAG: formate dehydrogenase subunit delta [Actinoplanes sp.]